MLVRIRPLDPIIFRDGKPFNTDSDMWASSMFPPFPSVLYGALRTIYFVNNPNNIHLAQEVGDPTANLRIRSVTYYDRLNGNEFLLPLPRDCVTMKGVNDKSTIMLSLKKLEGIASSSPSDYALCSQLEDPVESVKGGLINSTMLEEYLRTGQHPTRFTRLSEFLEEEPKIGIGIDHSRGTVKDGFLYRVGTIRVKNLEICVQYEGLTIPNSGFMQLGGEGRAAIFQHSVQDKEEIKPPKFESGNIFKLYLSTPAIFENGWIPSWISNDGLVGSINGVKLKLLAAAIGKPVSAGGFDIKKRKPKPMHRVVPSGSVYYFETINCDLQSVIKVFHSKSVSDINPEQGYGIAFVGAVNQ